MKTKLALGGGKMVDMHVDYGIEMIGKAMELGINTFDAHHRYGNCEFILSQTPFFSFDKNVTIMTKVSAYEDRWLDKVNNSAQVLNNLIDIMWVSDLDNEHLYRRGEHIYNDLKELYPTIGITTESPILARKFMSEHRDCKYLMIPIFIGNTEMANVCQWAQKRGITVFCIKPFNDSILLQAGFSIKTCLQFLAEVEPDYIIFGTSKIEHIEDTVKTWNSLT